jgi:hypothetical protein
MCWHEGSAAFGLEALVDLSQVREELLT